MGRTASGGKTVTFMPSIRPTLVPPFSLDQLRKFEMVVAHRSFTAAAEQLGLTQPAVSQQVRQLEKQLGVRLLERVGRAVTPTAAGIDLLQHVPDIHLAMETAMHAVRTHAKEVTGTVRLGTGVTTCLYLLPDILRQLHDHHPRLDLVISTGNTDDLVRRVEGNLLDLALLTMPVASHALSVAPILDDEIVAVRARGSRQWPAKVRAESLCERTLVMFGPGTTTRGLIDAWFARSGRKPKPSMELDSVEAIKAVVAAGLGYSLLPRMAVTDRGSHPGLEVRSLSPALRRTQAIAMRHDKPLGSALRSVANAVADGAKRRSASALSHPA